MCSEALQQIDTTVDIQVGTPLDRETIRITESGFLVVCDGLHCHWQGLFPSRDLACQAVKTHVDRARRSRRYHYGKQHPFVVELIDDRTAQVCPDQQLDPLDPYTANRAGQFIDRAASDRQPLDEVLHRGDLIERHGPGDGMVVNVSRTRCLGLPAFSIQYVKPDTEPNADGRYSTDDYYYLNNYVARDGGALSVMLDDSLDFKGHTEAQSDLDRWQ